MRSAADNEFLDMCEKCLSFTDIKTLTREDLREEVGTEIANYIDTEGNYND